MAGMVPGMAAQGAAGGGAHMGVQGALGSGMFGGGFGVQSALPHNSLPASPYGAVTCGKAGHYARNCWQAANRQRPEEENTEVRELLQRISKREKEEEDRKRKEVEETKKKEEEERRESEKLREEQAREAKLEATIVRILQQRKESQLVPPVPLIAPASHVVFDPKKRSPRSKAQMLQDIRSYIAESEDESEEVREEAEKLVEALESRKNSRKGTSSVLATASWAGKKVTPKKITPRKGKAPGRANLTKGDGFETPTKMSVAECSGDSMIEFALTQTKVLSGMKVNEIRKIYDQEGFDYAKKDITIHEIVRCRTRLAYEGFFELKSGTPSSQKAQGGGLGSP
ncbi:hypothetical protein CBR_g38845 [Chara braunii]|uniref:CCHC-type domain-containing protein n=1 Tax=Chara braunii TaxID=69332 RepID=A0A388LQR5_CHABU|nr:hypothetical protein CBR_g38845 [Chara braunii]|eukprot:GBG84563.1 hypothetical protein CBR_g38845 [Chara braunii]